MNKKIIAFTLALLATTACESPSKVWEDVTGLRPSQPVNGARRVPALNAKIQQGVEPIIPTNSPYTTPMLTQVSPLLSR